MDADISTCSLKGDLQEDQELNPPGEERCEMWVHNATYGGHTSSASLLEDIKVIRNRWSSISEEQ